MLVIRWRKYLFARTRTACYTQHRYAIVNNRYSFLTFLHVKCTSTACLMMQCYLKDIHCVYQSQILLFLYGRLKNSRSVYFNRVSAIYFYTEMLFLTSRFNCWLAIKRSTCDIKSHAGFSTLIFKRLPFVFKTWLSIIADIRWLNSKLARFFYIHQIKETLRVEAEWHSYLKYWVLS